MADLAALRSAHTARFTGAVRREVVLVHIALALGRVDGVKTLPLVEHAERGDGKRLGLTALEQAGTVDARQIAGHDVQGADLVGTAAVGALTGLDDHGAHGLLLKGLQGGGDVGAPSGKLLLVEGLLLDAGLKLFDLAHASLLVGIAQSLGHLVEERGDALIDGRVGDVDGPLDRGDVATIEEALLSLAELRDGLLAEIHGAQHKILGNLVGAGLDHGDVIGGTGDGELEVGGFLLLVGGVHDELVGLGIMGDAHASRRAVERGAADHKGCRSAADADAVGSVLAVAHKRGGNDVHLALEAVDEAGADGAVDHAGGQRALLGRTRLALEVAAGDAPDGVHLLHEVDGQREEVVVLLLFGDDGRDEHGGLALRDQDSAGSLLGQLAGFQSIFLAVQLEGLDDLFHVVFFPSLFLDRRSAGKLLRPGVLTFPACREQARPCAPDRYAKARARLRGLSLTRCCRGCRAS